jgi:Rrf2 family protein
MFRISRRLDYGLCLMVSLAEEKENHPQSTASLAEKLDIPLPFLHQIAHSLMQSGLIKATPGPRGGLRLNRASHDINVLQIVEALEGPIDLNPEPVLSGAASDKIRCTSQVVWDELQQKLLLQLSNVYLDMLINQADQMAVYAHAFAETNNN